MRQIIENTNSTLYVLEYTTNGSVKIPEEVLKDSLVTVNSDYEPWEMQKLSFSDYLEIITQIGLDKKSLDAILKYTYIKCDGDLRNITDTQILLGIDSNIQEIIAAVNNDNFNPQKFNINSLSENDKFILVVIATHNAEVVLDDLLYLNKSKELKSLLVDIDLVIERLEQQQLISKVGSRIFIKHDSITKEILNGNEYVRLLFIAYKIWSDYYAALYENSNFTKHSKEQVIYNLFKSYIYYSPEKCLTLLGEVKIIIANVIRPDVAIDYVQSLKQILNNNPSKKSEHFYLELLDICYEAGIFNLAYEILEMIAETSIRKSVYKAVLLNRLDRNQEAIDYINSILEGRINKRVELCLKLILFISYRSLLNFKQCKKLFREIDHDSDNKQYLEYGFFLRNSEITLSITDSIKYAKASIDFFMKNGSETKVAHSKITLSMLYAGAAQLQDALTTLQEAETVLIGKTLERHIVFNNMVAIYIYMSNFDYKLEELLNEARSTALTPFDKISVYINMLIFYKKTRNYERCEMVISNLLRIVKLEPDLIMHRFTYYHIAWFYKESNQQLDEYYLSLAKQIHNQIKAEDDYHTYWAIRLYGEGNVHQDYAFHLKFDFEPCFLTYWHFEIPKVFN